MWDIYVVGNEKLTRAASEANCQGIGYESLLRWYPKKPMMPKTIRAQMAWKSLIIMKAPVGHSVGCFLNPFFAIISVGGVLCREELGCCWIYGIVMVVGKKKRKGNPHTLSSINQSNQLINLSSPKTDSQLSII